MSLRIVTTPVTGSGLARTVVNGSSNAAWYVERPATTADWKARAALVRESLVATNWAEALAPAFAATGLAAERLERAAASGIAVTTGQQPGLFGGPLYTWWKALSALAFADRLELVTGLPVVPIFWAATDDADFAEASYTIVTTAEGAEEIRIQRAGEEGVSMGQMPLGDVTRELDRLSAAAGSAPNREILDLVRRCYGREASVGGAYIDLLRSVLEPLGIPVLDASHPAVRKAAHPVLRRAIEKAEAVENALAERAASLKSAGHSAQVKAMKGRTLVFAETKGKRDRVRIADAARFLSSADQAGMGPNVLLRPIVERSIIPTVAYMGGPGEIAYFAQVSAVADALDTPAPLIVPRWSGFVLEPRVQRILERHDLSIEDFRDPHAVESRLARASLPPSLKSGIDDMRGSLDKSVIALAAAGDDGMVPPGVLEGMKHNIGNRVDRLERRLSAGVKRRGNDALRDAAIARGALFPLGSAQDRSLNIVPLLARHGDDLFALVMHEAEMHAGSLA